MNVANAEIELSAKRVDEKLSVISVKDSGDATVDPNANTIRLPASYQISGVNGVKAFSVRFCICDREAIGANGCRQDRAIAVWDVESAEGMVMKPGSTTSIDKAVKIPHTDALALVLLPHERWAFTYGIRSAVFEDGSRFNIVDQVTLPWK